MKKLFIAVVLMFTLVCSAFAFTEGKRIKDVGIPSHVEFIQFNNGGKVVCSAEHADVSILVQSNESMLFTLTKDGNKIQFYVYEVQGDIIIYLGNGLTKKVNKIQIVDSESLSIIYY